MSFVFSGFSFILHLAHHLASLSRSVWNYSAAKSMFLPAQPIGQHHLQIATCQSGGDWDLDVIDIDKK